MVLFSFVYNCLRVYMIFLIPINCFARFVVAAILDCYNSYCFGIMVGLSDHALQSWINHNDS